MRQISESEFCDAVIATKKDARLVTAAKNDRTNSPASLYREFEKLPLERRREIIAAISVEQFVAAQWKIAFPLNNFPAEILPDSVLVAGKALFFTREEDSVRESIRAIKIYQNTPFVKRIAAVLAESAESAGTNLGRIAAILTDPAVFGLIKSLDPANPNSERIVDAIARVASYTVDLDSTLAAGKFLYARRHASYLPELSLLIENSIFLARDPKSVRQIIEGFTAGSVDVVLQRQSGNKSVLSAIRDIAWKARDWKVIRTHLQLYLN
jgi:hypothetical protein